MYGREKTKRKSKKELKEIKSMVKDKNFRIFFLKMASMFLILKFIQMGVIPMTFLRKMNVNDDASHSFYLGVELARAQIAYQLGKDYDQDNELNWGIAVEKKNKTCSKDQKLK